MDDIQKAIDDAIGYCNVVGDKVYGFRPEQLKFLLKEVATESFYAGIDYGANSTYSTPFQEWWEQQNLTFNKD